LLLTSLPETGPAAACRVGPLRKTSIAAQIHATPMAAAFLLLPQPTEVPLLLLFTFVSSSANMCDHTHRRDSFQILVPITPAHFMLHKVSTSSAHHTRHFHQELTQHPTDSMEAIVHAHSPSHCTPTRRTMHVKAESKRQTPCVLVQLLVPVNHLPNPGHPPTLLLLNMSDKRCHSGTLHLLWLLLLWLLLWLASKQDTPLPVQSLQGLCQHTLVPVIEHKPA
jgi:hypothetical protein